MKKCLPFGCMGRHGAIALGALALLCLACSPKAPEPEAEKPVYAFADASYDCVVHYVSNKAAFRLDFAISTTRSDEELELTFLEVPKLSEAWPPELPSHGLQALFEGDMAAPYSFGLGTNVSAAPFDGAMPWRFNDFLLGEDFDDLGAVFADVFAAADYGTDAVSSAVLLSAGLGASCAELEGPHAEREAGGMLKARVDGAAFSAETRTILDADGRIEARALRVEPYPSAMLSDIDWKPTITVEIHKRGGAGAASIAYEAPPLGTLQKPTTQGWYLPRIDGSTATIPLTRSLYKHLLQLPEEEAAALVQHNKTHQAFVNVVEGYADIAFVTEPSPEELAYAESRGVALSIVPVAREAFVFIVNAKNPVDNLALQDIRRIYRGELSWWSQIGSDAAWDTPIAAFIRPPNSGSQTLFEKLVLRADEIVMREYEEEGMGDLILSVAGVREHQAADEEAELAREVAWPDGDSGFQGGLGYTVYFYLSEMMANPDVKLIAVDGVFPEEASIVDGSYPLLSAYYAVTRSGADQPYTARALLEWLATRAGEAALREGKYIPWTSAGFRG